MNDKEAQTLTDKTMEESKKIAEDMARVMEGCDMLSAFTACLTLIDFFEETDPELVELRNTWFSK